MKVLFIDRVHPILEERLIAEGHLCTHNYTCDFNELKQLISDQEGLVLRSRLKVNKELLREAKSLKFIARSGAGLENIDLETCAELGIEVFNSPEGNQDAVGEHAVGMLLMMLNHLGRCNQEVRDGLWRREANRGKELNAMCVGLIGFGHMGQRFAQKLSGIGCEILAYDKYASKPSQFDYVQSVSLEALQQRADVISFHTPQTAETKHYFNSAFLEKCEKKIYLINKARGSAVDTSALLEGLKSGKVLGACLDVLEYEPSSFEGLDTKALPQVFKELCAFEQVIFSPHVAGWTEESLIKLSSFLADKIQHRFPTK